MSDAGWHPDPLGRADRRYHDGARWTEHVADGDGTTTVDPLGAGPAPGPPAGSDEPPVSPGIVIGPPAGSDEPPVSPGIVIGPPPPRRPRGPTPPRTGAPPSMAPPAASPKLARAALDEPITTEAPPAVEAASPRTQRMAPGDISAADGADATGRIAQPGGPPPGAGPGGPSADRAAAKARPSVPGLIGSVVGVGLGLVALFGLPWLSGGDGVHDASYLDLRDSVTAAGPDIGAIANGFIVSGALFVVAVGGLVALARSLGATAVRVLATVAVLGGLAALSVLGFLAMEVDDGPSAAVGPTAPVPVPAPPGSPVTTPTGDTIIDPATGAPVTTPDVGQAARPEGREVVVDPSGAEDRLAAAAVLGTAVMGVAAALCVIGLLLERTAGHLVAALGLLVGFGWAVGAVAVLSTGDGVGDLGLGPYGVAASALLLAVSVAIPGRRTAS